MGYSEESSLEPSSPYCPLIPPRSSRTTALYELVLKSFGASTAYDDCYAVRSVASAQDTFVRYLDWGVITGFRGKGDVSPCVRIQTWATFGELPLDLEGDWQPVVIDVLRATSTIVAALDAGAREVVPVATVDEALALRADDTLLAGERETRRVPGFDLGNSPRECVGARVGGRRVVLSTTNGTAALVRARHYGPVMCACFLNLSAVVERLERAGRDVLLVCAGTDERFSADDLAVAGAIVAGLPGAEADDLGRVAHSWFDIHREDLEDALAQTRHGRILRANGAEEDLAFCARRDVSGRVPIYDGEGIR